MKRLFSPVLAAGWLALLTTACDPSKPAPPPAEPPAPTNTVAEPVPPKPQFAKLLGRWERPDGGYVLELASVDAEGKLDARYFNPNPVKVERAQAAVESEGTRVFVVLRDTNYPGCIYKLTYDARTDQLFGTYYQAAMGETYDVGFARLRQE